jgi:ankyrin repeat protein
MADHADDDDDHNVDVNSIFEALLNFITPVEDILEIIDEHPDMIRRRNHDGHLPIHCAIQRGLSPRIVRRLLRSWPESARHATDDADRYLQAHLACLHANQWRLFDRTAVLAAVRSVVRAHPEALATKDARGRLPLHAAFMYDTAPLEVIELLLRKHPDALQVTDDRGYLPLHYAVMHRVPSLPAVKHLIRSWSPSVRERTKHGHIPLVLALIMDTPLDVAELLVSAWQGSVRDKCCRGTIPLHEAARAKSLPLVKLLVSLWPGSVRHASDSGRLPLHEAAAAGSASVVRFLVGHWHRSVQAKMLFEGRLPIHEAARSGRRDAVRYLVAQWPRSVQERTDKGWLPLHMAVWHRPMNRRDLDYALDSVRFLVRQHPQSVWDATNEGYLPIHVAAGCGLCFGGLVVEGFDDADWRRVSAQTELRLVRFLVRQAPTSLRTLSRDGKLPVHYAIEQGFSLPSVEFLCESWPTENGSPASAQFRTGNGLTALHLAAARKDPSLEHVEFLVRLRPQLLHEADPDGRLPVHYAAECEPPCLDVCRLLVEQRPESLRHAAHDGSLPLHLCVSRRAPSLAKVRYLVGRHPRALHVRDAHGSLPLHAALSQGQVQFELVEFLVEQEPKSLRQKDGRGPLPLHVAAVSDAALDVLYYLASKDPGCVRMERPQSCERPRPRKRRKPN